MKVFYQQEIINYTKKNSLVANMNSVRFILSLVAHFGLQIHQMDVKSVFIHGNLSEQIYMEQTLCILMHFSLVCSLKNLLHSLKLHRLKKQLIDSFDITDLSTLHYFLGLQVLLPCDGFFISYSKYVMDLLKCFNMDYCKPCTTPFHS
jgi:hypothetical protein